MSKPVTVDTSQINKLLATLAGDEKKKAVFGALRKSANILKKATDKAFKAGTKLDGETVHYRVGGEKAQKKIRGIAKTVIDRKNYLAKVHIMGDFRAKYFEKGTKVRYTKGRKITGQARRGKRIINVRTGKGRKTGNIKAQWIFKSTKQATERRIFDNMEKQLIKAIKRIANKNGRT
jgi:hypothetical protein